MLLNILSKHFVKHEIICGVGGFKFDAGDIAYMKEAFYLYLLIVRLKLTKNSCNFIEFLFLCNRRCGFVIFCC